MKVFENENGLVSPNSLVQLGHDDMVVEALAWGGVSDIEGTTLRAEGSGLLSIPKGIRPISIQSGVLGDGYISGPTINAQLWVSPADLLLTDWTPEQGNVIFFRQPSVQGLSVDSE